MSKSGLILAFYRDHSAATEALFLLRQKGFRRSAILQRKANDRFTQNRGGLPSESAMLVGGAVGSLVGRYLPLPRVANRALAPALGAATGAIAGYCGAQGADGGLPEALLRRQKSWLLRGDTVLITQASGSDLQDVVDVLRQSGQPAVYALRGGPQFSEEPNAPILRGDNFSSDQLREVARRLAGRHRAVTSSSSNVRSHTRLIDRLKDNQRVIAAATQSLVEAARLSIPVSIAAEWLLDNGYIVEGQAKDALQNLSRQFYAELPVLSAHSASEPKLSEPGAAQELPRVYALAVALVTQTDSRLDKSNIADFVQAYQEVTLLAQSELWALPLMLRVATVENLRRLASRIARHQQDREQASLWANRLLNAAHHDPASLPRLFADLAQAHPKPGPHFADRLVGNLFDEEAALSPARSWLESSLGVSLDEALKEDQRRQAVDQVTVANCVTSLRHLGNMDWRAVFESISIVESELRHDPAGVYPAMDFATRDRYRHEIEVLSRHSALEEREVARQVVALSGQVNADAPGQLRRHIGYYLLGDGRLDLERTLSFQPPLPQKAYRFVQNHATPLYLSSIAVGTGAVCTLGFALSKRAGTPLRVPLMLLGLLPASEIAVQIVNYFITRTLPTKPLPKMDFVDGVPDEWKTIVVVPTLLSSQSSIADDLQQLEIHYLSSIDTNLRFALLADYTDAPQAHMPDDTMLLNTVQRGIRELNSRYANGGDRFFLFHRGRVWSESESRWMGTERKRGKIEEVNRFLKGQWNGRPDESHPIAGDPAELDGIRFVITLDADTQMPHNTARRLIETLAHPLNRPQLRGTNSPTNARGNVSSLQGAALVERGYTIIQPRVTTTLPSATATRFARWFSDSIGRDPYTNVVSDVQQDLFGEGTYHGKGIYDLDAFFTVLDKRFPRHALLSHDLLEGAHVRVGYASDIEFLDDFPRNYLAYAKRQHRWIRGDWQIIDWLQSRVPTEKSKERISNPLSLMSRWRIVDNLRRSLLPVATTVFLVAGWLSGPAPAGVVTGLVLGNLFWPVIGQIIAWLTSDPTNPAKVKQLRQQAPTIVPNIIRSSVWAALLPHQALVALDAVVRVLYRKFYSHKLLLQWQTARSAGQSTAEQEKQFLWRLSGAALFAGALSALLYSTHPSSLVFAALFLCRGRQCLHW